MKYYFTVFFLICCLFCAAQSTKVLDSKDKRIIDLDKAKYPDTCFSASNLYKSAKIIPLETNASCLIGSIDKIQVIDQYILILDGYNAKSLFVFDKEGRFVRKIGSVGQGPGEYNSIGDFTIDRDSKTVYIKDGRASSRIYQYDLTTGKYIQLVVLERLAGSAGMRSFVSIGGNLYASALFSDHSTNNYLLFSIDEASGKEKNNFLNVMEYNKGFSNLTGQSADDRAFFSRENGEVIFVQPLMNHIIEITKDGVFSLFELKGKNMLTTEEAKKVHESFNVKRLIESRGGLERFEIKKYKSIHSYVEKGEWIKIEMGIGITLHSIMINKKSNEVFVYKCFPNDVLYKITERSSSFLFGCTDSNGVYYHTSTIRSNGIPELKEFHEAGALSPDVIGLEKIKGLKDDDNPILLYFEFKE